RTITTSASSAARPGLRVARPTPIRSVAIRSFGSTSTGIASSRTSITRGPARLPRDGLLHEEGPALLLQALQEVRDRRRVLLLAALADVPEPLLPPRRDVVRPHPQHDRVVPAAHDLQPAGRGGAADLVEDLLLRPAVRGALHVRGRKARHQFRADGLERRDQSAPPRRAERHATAG